ncbi:hypothetical protein [Acidocella aromatica]|uniref:Glycosyltransferase RgtA/B/C/D-like domain-containing protein n=1 Tax=Acidocella aromatica TaxID=1303579 RepID=A0A840VC74_9PROT|nr:hypothetical protein [Acidocella aromatica]MBB5372447.1 hypothetical protein [Acidocella aromatica]
MYLLPLFLLAAGLNILLGMGAWPSVLAGNLQDPDSYMRLLRIEQGIRAGHLLTSVAGDQSGAGVMVEWSRLLDMLLWLMAAPLTPFIGWHKALFAAGLALGPLGVGFLGAVLAWAVEPFALRRYLWSAALAAAVLPGIVTIAVPGVVHYHVLLLAMIALTAGFTARAWRDNSWAGFLAGLSGGFAIWLTPETMPFVLMAYASLLLRWFTTPNATVLFTTAAGCFDVLMVGLFIDPPAGGYFAPEVDRLSCVYAAMGLLFLAGASMLTRLPNRRWRGVAGFVVLAALFGVWVAIFPGVVLGPYGILPPNQAQAFFGVITEQMPVHGRDAVMFLFPGAAALAYALWRGLRRHDRVRALLTPEMLKPRGDGRVIWLYLALCGAVALVLGAKFLLFVGFSTIFAAAMLPVALSQASVGLAEKPLFASLARVGLLALVFGVPELAAIANASPKQTAATPVRNYPSCKLHNIAPLLAQAAGDVVLAGPEAAPELLYRTHVQTVGSLFHHGIAGYMRDRAAWRAVPGIAVPPEVTATGAAYVLFCPSPARYLLVADLPKATLWDTLEAGTPPPWLSAAGRNAEGWTLYKITR